MKWLLYLLTVIAMAACGNTGRKKSAEGFEGVFARKTDDSTGVLEDTFRISKFGDGSAAMFTIKRSVGIINVDDSSRRLPKQRKEETWSADYNEAQNVLTIRESGERYVLSNDGISNGQLTYRRLH